MRRSRRKQAVFQTSRPAIPIPCAIALACLVGVVASSWVLGLIGREHATMLTAGCGVSVMLVLVCAVRWRGVLASWLAVFLLVGLALGALQIALLDHDRSMASSERAIYSFTLTEDSKIANYGSQVRASVNAGPQTGTAVLLFLAGDEPLYVGDVVTGETQLSVPDEDYVAYYDQRGLSFSAKLKDYQRLSNDSWLQPIYHLRTTLLEIVGSGSNEQTLLRAIMLGERRDLFDASFYRDIKVVGLAHLVAVSGAHLVIVTGFIALILRRLRLPAKVMVSAQTLFLLFYLVLVGFPISCIRAAIMSGVTLFALVVRRRSSSLTALGVTTLLMIAFDPSVVYSLSFQLSVTSTLGIVLFMPLINEWIGVCAPWLTSFARETLSMTLAALLLSLPISAAQFSTIPIISPLANLIATPYLTVLLMLGFLSLAVQAIAPFVLEVLMLVTSGLIAIIEALGSLPWAAIPVSTTLGFTLPLALAGAVILWLWWPRPRRDERPLKHQLPGWIRGAAVAGCLIVGLVVACLHGIPSGDRIVMLDVGQGDSFALMSGGETVLVDTGNEPTMLYAALARQNIYELDAVIITHPDDDHCGSLKDLVGVVAVKQVIVAEGLDEADDAKARMFLATAQKVVGEDGIVEVNEGDTIRFGSFRLDVVAPETVAHDGGNEDSICFYARLDIDHDGTTDWNAFFCGDAEAEVLSDLAEEGLLEAVDIYKVGHHGSRKALSDETAAILHPKVALIGVGKNSYGHPTEETLDRLSAVGSQQFRSDLCGDVVCSFVQDCLEVSTQRMAG